MAFRDDRLKKGVKVAVAMSGGVDSSTVAALLKKQGHDVVGFFMFLNSDALKDPFVKKVSKSLENKCCGPASMREAHKVAMHLKIPFFTVDFTKDFKKMVIDRFLGEYAKGRTPNPCVFCNEFIKFGKLLEFASYLECDLLATGHYARVKKSSTGYKLLNGKDKIKDQSYFLWKLTQVKLEQVLYPVGHYNKSRVREIAKAHKLPVAKRPESFEICFVPDDDYKNFLKSRIPEAIVAGEIVDSTGKVVGEHEGLPLYTIGQRKGLNVTAGVPLYVIGKNTKKNQLIVGRGRESEQENFDVEEVNWISGEFPLKTKSSKLKAVSCFVRIRHQGKLMNAEVRMPNKESGKVTLKVAARGVTPGQSAVFYRKLKAGSSKLGGYEVLGGGIIS